MSNYSKMLAKKLRFWTFNKVEKNLIMFFVLFTADSSADPLLDEHFRRSLGANYQSLFKKTSPTPPPQLVTSSVSQNHHMTSRVSQNHCVTSSMKSRSPSLSPDSSSSSLKVVDPVVKAFKDDMDMEGYTGITTNFLLHLT